ncbi:MAG: hypothetical protein CSA96_06870 [Bacteroidetes bacterium]|nr:MAG: hypothetical protein CSA96_06870 [Bacteroidota bacterium]
MKTKTIVVVILTILIVIFAVQNTEAVNVQLLFWKLQIPRALLIFCCLAVGILIGLMIPSTRRKKPEVV